MVLFHDFTFLAEGPLYVHEVSVPHIETDRGARWRCDGWHFLKLVSFTEATEMGQWREGYAVNAVDEIDNKLEMNT